MRKIVSTHATRAGRDHGWQKPDRPCFLVSTHATRAGRDFSQKKQGYTWKVSTHATRAGRDEVVGDVVAEYQKFQLTRPVRVATTTGTERLSSDSVSTHATRAGRDAIFHDVQQNTEVSTHATRAGRDRRTI